MIDDKTWRAFERSALHRERSRLIRSGVITPLFKMKPQMLIKNDDGSWSPQIKVN